MKSIRKLVIILIGVSVVAFSAAYAAATGNFQIFGTNQKSQPQPDVYFVNNYDSLASFVSEINPSTSGAGTATVSQSGPHKDIGEPYQTGKSVTISGSTYDYSSDSTPNDGAYVQWTLPIKNYGSGAAAKGNCTIQVKLDDDATTTYNFSYNSSENKWISDNTSLTGLSFTLTSPDTLAASADDAIVVKAILAKSDGLKLGSDAKTVFSYTIDVPYNAAS